MELLTELKIKALRATDKEQNFREKNGFILRVRPEGSKTFYHTYDYQNKRCRLRIGNWPTTSLSEARNRHRENLTLLQQGIDPRSAKITLPESAPGVYTVTDLARDYIQHCQKNKSAAWATEEKRLANKYITPALGNRPAADIRRRDAVALIESLAATAPGTARGLLKSARAMWTWAIDREKAESNPFSGVSRAVQEVRPKERERVLLDQEIRNVWKYLTINNNSQSEITRRALLTILVTGQRPGEVSGMLITEIQHGEGKPLCKTCRRCAWWTIPADRAKNGTEHSVFLPELAKQIIGHLPTDYTTGPVFSGKTDTNTAISRAALSQYIKKNKQLAGMNFTPHDLRRTCATGLSRLGCPDEIIDAVLNHQKTGIIRVYNRNRYENEKREWLSRWSEYLQSII